MFAKLLKHEIKSVGGLLGLLSLGALGVGVIGGLLMRITMNLPDDVELMDILLLISEIAIPFAFLSLVAYAIGGMIFLAVQFYKRKFTDQGYLTFTLPVPVWQIYLTSLLNIMLWTIIILVVVIIAFVCIFLIGMYDTEVWHRLLDMNRQLGLGMEDMMSQMQMDFSPIHSIVEFVSGNVLMITAITLGAVLAKKHKVLGALGSYYGMSLVITAIHSALTTTFLDSANFDISMAFILATVTNLIAIAGGSALSIWLMSKKLNLP